MNADDGPALTGAALPGSSSEPETALVTMTFDASDPDELLGALSKYVVLARGEVGCRNVDLCSSLTRPSRIVIIEKWDSETAARAHFDSALMVEMATACDGNLSAPPDIDLLDGLSAHDYA